MCLVLQQLKFAAESLWEFLPLGGWNQLILVSMEHQVLGLGVAGVAETVETLFAEDGQAGTYYVYHHVFDARKRWHQEDTCRATRCRQFDRNACADRAPEHEHVFVFDPKFLFDPVLDCLTVMRDMVFSRSGIVLGALARLLHNDDVAVEALLRVEHVRIAVSESQVVWIHVKLNQKVFTAEIGRDEL